MSLFKKSWTADEADGWTQQDFWACVFGVLAFFLVTIGIAGALLLQAWGYVALAFALVFTWLTYKVIDPKLRAMSQAFEEKQADYLDEVERQNRWEREHGN
jgi:predicted tellurium resistance membrane protein TerC